MITAEIAWWIMGAGLVVYVLTGGADLGGGVWDLLATGPRKEQQRETIEHAIAPIWEVNHIWLIFIVVLMFTAFPKAFAVLGIALHVPLTLALVGIVLRGAAFSFRSYGLQPTEGRRRWGRVFAWSSLVTPVLLGMSLGAVSTGDVRVVEGRVVSGLAAGWTTPFAFLVGAYALVLFALLAAVYLTLETRDALRSDFRARALVCEVVAGVIASLVLWRSSIDARALYEALVGSQWTLPVQGFTAFCALGTCAALWARRFQVARALAIGQVAGVVVGWGLAMDGHIVMPDITVRSAGARQEVLDVLGPVLVGGSLVLVPALFYLFRLFKSHRA